MIGSGKQIIHKCPYLLLETQLKYSLFVVTRSQVSGISSASGLTGVKRTGHIGHHFLI
jgi:hypothetical protein